MKQREFEIRLLVIIAVLALSMRLFYLQIVDDSYKKGASENAVRHIVQYPPRGEIYDRNGLFLAQSNEAYDLLVTPRNVEPFDTLKLCSLIGIEKETLVKAMNSAKRYSFSRPSVIFKQLPKEVKMNIEEFSFPGFTTQYRTIRAYPNNTAGNILGYVGEVSSYTISQDDYYKQGDYSGMTGIERAYETTLRGVKGDKLALVDVHGAPQGSYADGRFDRESVWGTSLVSTIDADLQLLGEELMQNKIGSIVAIEPSSGEILMMVSSPTYNPNDLIGRDRSKNYQRLALDTQKPFFNRAVMAYYPPGSVFKLAVALSALQHGLVTPETKYPCSMGFHYGNRKIGCHSHKSPIDLYYSIQTSCNAYYCNVYRSMLTSSKYGSEKEAFDDWRSDILSMGFGRKLDSDFKGELNGYIPTSDFYDRVYNGRWNSYTILSNSIGQGEVGATPLQLANFVATIANGGYYYIPHIIKAVGDDKSKIDKRFYERHYTNVDAKHYEVVTEAMWRGVNIEGTPSRCRIEGLDVCAKTGTAENPHGRDHSTFAAFAPRNNPKIAISVYVENGGFGATIALPIAKLIIEKYLLGEIKSTDLYDYAKDMKIYYKNER